MNIKQLEYMQAIAEKQSLTAAAEAHFISQSALSQQLMKLEQTLGAKLFDRQKKTWTPTPAGLLLLKAAGEILSIHTELLDSISQLANQNRNTIVLGITQERSSLLLSKVLPLFQTQYPDMTLRFEEAHMPILHQMVLEGRIDLALTAEMKGQKFVGGLQFEPVYREDLVLVAYSGHKFAKRCLNNPKEMIDLSELAGERFICHGREKGIRQLLDLTFEEIGCVPKETIAVNSTRSVVEFVLSAVGIAIVPKMFALSYPAVRIIPTEPQLCWLWGILHRCNNALTIPEKCLLRLFQEVFAEMLQE